jgi:hypothetical protein
MNILKYNFFLVMFFLLRTVSDAYAGNPLTPKDKIFVPTAEVAVQIAEAILVPIYGKEVIVLERPFKATLKKDIWFVEGQLPDDPAIVGGVSKVTLDMHDGRILTVYHEK